jgi:ribosomal protein S17E
MSEWNDAIEEAAKLMDRWESECDRSDYDDNKRADQFEHNAKCIRMLKRPTPSPA